MFAVVQRPVIAVIVLSALSACSSIKPVSAPEFDAPSLLAGFTHPADNDQIFSDPWWQLFSDVQLNRLIQQGLANNYDLKSSLARLRQSEALLRIEASSQYPSVSVSAGKSRRWQQNATSDGWTAGLNASYEIDFWGAVVGAKQQAEYQLLASRSASRIQANTVASQIATAWFGLLHESNHLHLLEQQKQRVESGLKVINARFQRGQAQVSDVWQQQTLLESINADTVSASSQRDIYRQQLQLWLAGELNVALDNSTLPEVTNHQVLISTASLFERPDVQQAFFNVQAANAGVAIAEASRYPRFTLTASYSGESAQIENVFDNWAANLAGNLLLPLIDGGNRRAQVKSQQALLESQLAAYQQVYLEAAQQVQEVLVRLQEQQRLNGSLQAQLLLAKKTESFQTSRYRKGVGDYLSLLNAQREVLALERQQLTNQRNFNQSRIRLYQAVSHGRFFANNHQNSHHERLPSADESRSTLEDTQTL